VGAAIPDENHVARYCKPFTFDEDGQPTLTAFLLRAAETYLSVNWLESLPGADTSARLASLRAAIARDGNIRPAKTGKYAILHVGTTRRVVHDRTPDQRWIRVTEEAEGYPAYHAGIRDTANDELVVAQAILDSAIGHEPAIWPQR
jgi:hypothetical protein